jgi:hypothetical protein
MNLLFVILKNLNFVGIIVSESFRLNSGLINYFISRLK